MAKRVPLSSQDMAFGDRDSKPLSEALDSLFSNPDEEIARDTEFEAVMHQTSSSNPTRPRTVSAGYDSKTMKMTVVFRDGTWWEYRDVPQDIWDGFKSALSKGVYLRESGLDSWDDMGPADITAMPTHRRMQMQAASEWANNMYVGLGRNKE